MSSRPVKHSLTLNGHRTSVSLEAAFWDAVSYTHLDVYKRQLPFRHRLLRPNTKLKVEFFMASVVVEIDSVDLFGINTVSYTHLDVYKRQWLLRS